MFDRLRFLFTGVDATGQKHRFTFWDRVALLLFPHKNDEEIWPEHPDDLQRMYDELWENPPGRE